MNELQENVEAAVANAAAKIAVAETAEEAQQWQSVISNLTASLGTINAQVDRSEVESKAAKPVQNQTKG